MKIKILTVGVVQEKMSALLDYVRLLSDLRAVVRCLDSDLRVVVATPALVPWLKRRGRIGEECG